MSGLVAAVAEDSRLPDTRSGSCGRHALRQLQLPQHVSALMSGLVAAVATAATRVCLNEWACCGSCGRHAAEAHTRPSQQLYAAGVCWRMLTYAAGVC
jgi:hypothetical protein